MLSVIINTAAGASHAKHALSSGGVPYSWRAYALQNHIIPRYIAHKAVKELIIVGEWHTDAAYKYVHVPAVHHNWGDCIIQRQAGFEAATGDWLVFQHDDHWIDFDTLPPYVHLSDVWSPSRWTYARKAVAEELNSGFFHYIDGHGALYKRMVLDKCPWKNVPVTFTLDVEHTRQIIDAGFNVTWRPDFRIYDCEHGATPWL